MQPPLPPHLLASLSNLLATHTGLHFPAERWHDLGRGISAAASAFGMPDAASCAHRLLAAPLTQRDIEILARCLTVGETYFFREKRSFDALEQHVVPTLLRAHTGGERPLRVWSAGCCTGEEPYSIAMLLDRLVPQASASNVTILATDINLAFLRTAAEGEYSEWSFRGVPRWIKDRYFQPRRGKRFQLDDRIRQRVAFSYLNLADDNYPSLTNNTNAMDVIFCRNVLMYFSAERARAVVDRLYRALVDGGWLVVSPAETSNTLFSGFTAVEFDGAILYRKDAGAAAPRFVSHVPAPLKDGLAESGWRAAESMPEEGQPTMPLAARPAEGGVHDSSPLPTEPDLPSRQARDCANQGRLDEAVEWCLEAIATDKLNPAHHYLLAAIQQERGQIDAAAQALARVLYLDPHFVIAHYALGNLRQSQGRELEAQRHFGNALASLKAHPPDEVLPESDGLTAGRLLEMIQSIHAARS